MPALVAALLGGLVPPAQARVIFEPRQQNPRSALEIRIAALAERQREELGIPDRFLPFLRDDAKVNTGRQLWGTAAPNLSGSSAPEILETDLRYRYSVAENQQILPTVESEVNTRITVRDGATGRKLWSKRYPRDAYPFAMRVGDKGRWGVVVLSGFWNFYGTTEENTLSFDAFEGRRGKHLWTREYKSISYYDLLTSVTKDAPIVIAPFNGLKGRSHDLLIGLATMVNTGLTTTTATRVEVIDGADGTGHLHPLIDVGVDWWPVPLPTRDLDGDGLDDYGTTNNFGFDPGDSEAQQGPSVGGTLYTRRGVDGTPIWTTSGLKMAIFAWVDKMPDVAGDRTADVALQTYVHKQESLPIDLPLLGLLDFYIPRIYLFEGDFGAEMWHKAWHWIYSPGDIDRNGRADLMLGKYRAFFRKNKTIFDQLALAGSGQRLWMKRSVWRFETMPCPEDLCFGGYWFGLDASPDFQPDRVRDVLTFQGVEQNAAFEDRVTRLFDGRTGRLRLEDRTERDIQTAGVAIDGHGSDLMTFETKNNKVHVTARNAWMGLLWEGTLGGPEKILPRNSWFWAHGFVLPGDRCGDVIINGGEDDNNFYGVFDGGNGRLLWWKWTGPRDEHPTFTERRDKNPRC